MPITAKLVADLITTAGADRILTMDLHAGQLQGFFDIPVDNLYASPLMIPYISKNFNHDLAIVSPDAGGVPRARAYAKRLGATLGLIDKRRDAPGKAKAMSLIGDVMGKEVVILDDIIDTAGTLSEAAGVIIQNGARKIHACCTHAVLSGPAVERVTNSELNRLVVTDTNPVERSRGALPENHPAFRRQPVCPGHPRHPPGRLHQFPVRDQFLDDDPALQRTSRSPACRRGRRSPHVPNFTLFR